MRLFDFYLWAQLFKVWSSLAYVVLILFVERTTRLVMFFSSLIIPVAVLDYLRQKVVGTRLLRGFRDPDIIPELYYDTPQLCEARGYPCEEHYVRSPDGFILGLHRIPHGKVPANTNSTNNHNHNHNSSKDNSSNSRSNKSHKRQHKGTNKCAQSSESNIHEEYVPRPVVFVMHGFLQSSEAFVTVEGSLAFALADAGFDVWLGNNRGNKYSTKHENLKPHNEDYWDFSFDEVARLDIPTVIQYILHQTKAKKLSYIGFSQGTAVAFAAFAINHDIAQKVNLFIALAPATHLKRFSNSLVDAVTRSSPDIIYLLFSRKAMLTSTLFWQNFLSVSMSNLAIDLSCRFLFNWDMKNIDPKEKSYHYAHIFSHSSVKTVVHWFQLMNAGRFQMHDDHLWSSQNNRSSVLPHYAIEQITCPIALFHGGRDTLPDTKKMISSMPPETLVYEESTFEHMDFLYALGARERVYPRVIELCQAANAKHQVVLKKGSSMGLVSGATLSSSALYHNVSSSNASESDLVETDYKEGEF